MKSTKGAKLESISLAPRVASTKRSELTGTLSSTNMIGSSGTCKRTRPRRAGFHQCHTSIHSAILRSMYHLHHNRGSTQKDTVYHICVSGSPLRMCAHNVI